MSLFRAISGKVGKWHRLRYSGIVSCLVTARPLSLFQATKVVLLEDLAAHFKLKTQEAIDRVNQLQEDGELTGVVDDRGKFIYISQEELEAVAKFIRQRGRVSIAELAESSNKLINLAPEQQSPAS